MAIVERGSEVISKLVINEVLWPNSELTSETLITDCSVPFSSSMLAKLS